MEKRKLAAPERPKTKTRFTVTGSGEFPFDMLRYDGCFPAASADSYGMGAVAFTKKRTVTLDSFYERAPTVDRWKSFGWEVVDA